MSEEPPPTEPLAIKPPIDRIAVVAGWMGFFFVIVFALIPIVASTSKPPANRYDQLSPLTTNTIFICLLLLLVFFLGFVGPILGLISIARNLVSKTQRRCKKWVWLAFAPVWLIAGFYIIGDSSHENQVLKARNAIRRARESGDQEKLNRLMIEHAWDHFEDEFYFTDLALGRYRRLSGSYPSDLIPHVHTPVLGMKNAMDLPHDPFGEVQTEFYEFHNELNGWIIHNPHAIAENEYRHLDGSKIDPTKVRRDNDERFYPQERAFYRYFGEKNRYILIGRGPDEDSDITDNIATATLHGPNPTSATLKQYDPTNGMVSDGDIFRVMDYPY